MEKKQLVNVESSCHIVEKKRTGFLAWFEHLKKHKGFELISAFVKSAAVGLLFAVICFVYDVYHDTEQDVKLEASIDKLKKIEQSLSTRYLGIFPEYISEIDRLFDDLETTDNVVICEDVLYYGIKSRPREFRNLNEKLFAHLMNGGKMTIAYYNYNMKGPLIINIFHKMIIESRIAPKYHVDHGNEFAAEMRRLRDEKKIGPDKTRYVDSLLCEKYFDKTKYDDTIAFWKDVNQYLCEDMLIGLGANASASDFIVDKMCKEIDAVKKKNLGNKSLAEIHFHDYENMYQQMSEVISRYYNEYGVTQIPMDEYLTMSCWLVQKNDNKNIKAVLAFPSKYSTEEIGFYSQDEAFSKYIVTMVEGIKNNSRKGRNID